MTQASSWASTPMPPTECRKRLRKRWAVSWYSPCKLYPQKQRKHRKTPCFLCFAPVWVKRGSCAFAQLISFSNNWFVIITLWVKRRKWGAENKNIIERKAPENCRFRVLLELEIRLELTTCWLRIIIRSKSLQAATHEKPDFMRVCSVFLKAYE